MDFNPTVSNHPQISCVPRYVKSLCASQMIWSLLKILSPRLWNPIISIFFSLLISNAISSLSLSSSYNCCEFLSLSYFINYFSVSVSFCSDFIYSLILGSSNIYELLKNDRVWDMKRGKDRSYEPAYGVSKLRFIALSYLQKMFPGYHNKSARVSAFMISSNIIKCSFKISNDKDWFLSWPSPIFVLYLNHPNPYALP